MKIPTEGWPREKFEDLLKSAQALMTEHFPDGDSVAYLAGMKFFFKDQHGDSVAIGVGDEGYDKDEDDLYDLEGEEEC